MTCQPPNDRFHLEGYPAEGEEVPGCSSSPPVHEDLSGCEGGNLPVLSIDSA